MLNAFSRYILFASSYSPLAVAFGILYLRSDIRIAVALFVLAILSFVLLILMLGSVRGMATQPVWVESSARKDSDTLSYLATYLIPFALSPPKDGYDLGAMSVFVIVLAYLYVNSNMIYINPALSALGYHLYEVTPPNSKRTIVVLARVSDDLPSTLNVVELSRRIYVAFDRETR